MKCVVEFIAQRTCLGDTSFLKLTQTFTLTDLTQSPTPLIKLAEEYKLSAQSTGSVVRECGVVLFARITDVCTAREHPAQPATPAS